MEKGLCYATVGIGWALFIVAYIKGLLSLSVETFLSYVSIASIIQVYSLKYCDLIMLGPPQTKPQTLISTLLPIIMAAYFCLMLLSFPLNITLTLAFVYWFYLGFLMLLLVEHHKEKLKKTHPLFFYTTLSTGHYLVGTSLLLVVWHYTGILLIPNLQKMIEIKDIKSVIAFFASFLFLFSISWMGIPFIRKFFHISIYLGKLAKSKKKSERKLFMKLIKDSWAYKVDQTINILRINRLFLLVQAFLLWVLFLSSCIYFLYTLNLAYITIIMLLLFASTASFNYSSRSYGYQKIKTFLKDLVTATPSKKAADNILNFLIGAGSSCAFTAITLPATPEPLMVNAYINFIYFLIVALASVIGKILNPKYRPRIAMLLYWAFFIGTGGFTGMIAAAFKIPPLIDAFIAGTFLAFATLLNSLIYLKLQKT